MGNSDFGQDAPIYNSMNEQQATVAVSNHNSVDIDGIVASYINIYHNDVRCIVNKTNINMKIELSIHKMFLCFFSKRGRVIRIQIHLVLMYIDKTEH